MCLDASNFNVHVVADEASLSQFILGEEYRMESFSYLPQLLNFGQRLARKMALVFHVLQTPLFHPFIKARNGANICFYAAPPPLIHYRHYSSLNGKLFACTFIVLACSNTYLE